MTIDIHAHVLPGLDDGPDTLAEADVLLRAFRDCGVETVICTPHYLHPMFDVTKEQIDAAFAELTAARPSGAEADAWPRLLKGAEVRVTRRLVDDLRSRTVPTLGDTNYVLVEFPSQVIDDAMFEMMHELLVRDYQPIMAHPERNVAIQKDTSLIKDFIDAGVLMQVTASCFDAPRNAASAAVRVAEWMQAQGYVHFVASDAHNLTSRPPSDAKWLRGIPLEGSESGAAQASQRVE
ncbi:hypothetical protein JI721_04730 [Alicyclobacillus cycloheptanicus]|uniref:Tyrosine-protein phosphatase n=1 Tax=Alicyclobacillus cycloheptanicus TaxID=1457 RepID=A0ABT9XNY8_9BACL|nr:CpsB/CapC family capsule biosynthesis tyrosine phosphatase [Alicyclobacillus cycloheptanicus]MDQ0191416.1 protein-tyrosine phosphatase [Alicyclobacillus cycloheptanicus]WDM02130.1 hypothetical protein JI721_04730 [Alicyclobacillus cycloheptanicus]